MATELADYTGRFAAFAQDPRISLQISSLILQDPVTPLQLRQIVFECSLEIHHIAVDNYGSVFLMNLVQKLRAMGLVSDLVFMFSQLTRDANELKSTIGLNQTGCKTLFCILDCLPSKKQDLLYILGSIWVDMFYYSDDLKHLFDPLFQSYRPTELEPMLLQIAWNFLLLSKHYYGNKNICSFVDSACMETRNIFVTLLPHDFWKAAYSKKGNILLQMLVSPLLISKLRGHFIDLSMNSYSNWLVKSCLDRADHPGCIFIATELDQKIGLLIRHQFGNYVVQQLIRKFKLPSEL